MLTPRVANLFCVRRRRPAWCLSPRGLWHTSTSYQGLAKKCVVASADGQPWDLKRPLGVASHGDKVSLKLHTFDDAEGKETFWHSTSHILGEVLEAEYGVDLTIGPAIAEGFYYDCYMGDRVLTEADHVPIKAAMEKAVKEKQE